MLTKLRLLLASFLARSFDSIVADLTKAEKRLETFIDHQNAVCANSAATVRAARARLNDLVAKESLRAGAAEDAAERASRVRGRIKDLLA